MVIWCLWLLVHGGGDCGWSARKSIVPQSTHNLFVLQSICYHNYVKHSFWITIHIFFVVQCIYPKFNFLLKASKLLGYLKC